MVFSSPIFLFIFLPCFFGIYWLLPRHLLNAWILISSILFYALGAGPFTFIPLILVFTNWGIGLLMEKSWRRQLLWSGIVVNLLPLLLFKYSNFIIQVVSDVTGSSYDIGNIGLILPLGISFYSFHFISYLLDVYHRRIVPERNLANLITYIFLFPHLVAGPIVRFSEIASQLGSKNRLPNLNLVFTGLAIFTIGLAKKILIADPLGSVVNSVHGDPSQITVFSSWISALCYSFQIYFDFSGYTEMAIGMAAMMGFNFPQNFNRPYTSHNITEFWRRWHVTLSRWFRDYVYIPLGGNRISASKTYWNLALVFFLCGLWHGAAYTFLIWGLAHGLLLVLERLRLLRLEKTPYPALATFLVVTVLWIPFRSGDLVTAINLTKALVGIDTPFWSESNRILVNPKVIFLLALSFAICFIKQKWFDWLKVFFISRPTLTGLYCFLIYFLACISVVESGFNPFIYFQF
jgi:alginate O-acetyltransferase complex protein AlgI